MQKVSIEGQLFVKATKSSLAIVRDWLEQQLCRLEIEHEHFYRIDLTVNEWVSNIILHGCCAEGPQEDIHLVLRGNSEAVVVTVLDCNAPFNPCSLDAPERPSDLLSAIQAGFGIPTIRRNCNRLEYSRTRNGENCLEMTFLLS